MTSVRLGLCNGTAGCDPTCHGITMDSRVGGRLTR